MDCNQCGKHVNTSIIYTPMGLICRQCFKQHYIIDMTWREIDSLYDDYSFNSVDDMLSRFTVTDVASMLGYDVILVGD